MTHFQSLKIAVRSRAAPTAVILALLFIVVSCSEPAPVSPRESKITKPINFTADDKRAAQALSLGNAAALKGGSNQYDQSLLCSISIESIMSKLRDTGTFSPQQLASVEKAKKIYDERASAAAKEQSKSRADISRDRAQLASKHQDEMERARLSIGCLKSLM
ncbi:hypothetical protein GRI58_03840 [Porphyrobacter algicida]|uniref:Uncharacterized protein n=1 Tax=Qipengyuania algicida TaxID=1836209 RepID=A0A845AFE9_9SPHN|nr:hypothetical protein [Qipengyuania algicida]MXP27953.1 hypothetical protein [Qipengyuania algicida]